VLTSSKHPLVAFSDFFDFLKNEKNKKPQTLYGKGFQALRHISEKF